LVAGRELPAVVDVLPNGWAGDPEKHQTMCSAESLSNTDKNRTLVIMRYYTFALRGLLLVLAAGIVLAYLVLYIVSLDLAQTYPALGHLRIPLFITAVVAAIPGMVALHALLSFAALVARGEAFSTRTVTLLRRIRNCFAVTAVYLLVAFVGVTVAMAPGQSPSVFLAWCVGEVISLFLFTFAAVMVGLFANATTLREEQSLTV
jgi:hypothetical protein